MRAFETAEELLFAFIGIAFVEVRVCAALSFPTGLVGLPLGLRLGEGSNRAVPEGFDCVPCFVTDLYELVYLQRVVCNFTNLLPNFGKF